MALLNWLTDRVYDTFYQDDKKRLAQSNAAYQQQVQAHQNRNVLSPQQYTQQLRGAAQNANNAVRYNAPAPRPQQPTPQIKKPTVNQATLTGRNLKTAAGMALTPGGAPLAPAALLGAFDKEGPFSAYHQQQFKNFTNPVTSKLQEYNDWVNKDDPTEGFQINSLGDWGRLGRTLLPSMALGLMEAPVKSAEAASGSGIRDDKKTDLTPLQRVGSGADAAITVGGLPYGGSGTFMKSLLPKTAKTLAPAGGNLLKTLASGTWNIAKDAGKEGVEEVVQTFASDLSDDSRVNTPLTQYRDAGVTGAAGGTLFSGAGKTIEFTKSVPSRVDTSIHNNLSKNDPNYQSLLFEREYTTNNLEKTAIDQKLQQARQQVITQAPGKVVNKAKTDIESLQQIPHERTIQHPEVQAIAEQGNVLRQHRTDLMNRGLSYNSPAVKAVENAMRELGKDYNATYKRVYEQTKQEMLEPLIKANEFTRNHLIPGGTLAGPLAGDFSKAQKQGLVFEGVDGRPRFEVDDSGAKINIDALKPYAGTDVSYAKLGELLDHQQLFDNYPHLRDVEVASTPSVKGVENARMRSANNMEINPNLLKDPAKLKSTLLHEAQHAIQGKEGFAGGADPVTAGKDMTKAQAVKREKLQKQFADAQRAGTDTKGILNKIIQLENDIGYDAYFRSAGEAEARAVQARMNMPMSERYVDGKNTLDDSLDVPKQDLIIKNGEGKAMSIDPLESLRQEALKYKSAEEFVKSQSKNWDWKSTSNVSHNNRMTKDLTDLYNQVHSGKAMSVEPKLSDTDLAYINETVAQYSNPQKYINDQVEAIWARNKQGQGVDTALITKENSYDVEKRVTMSNNTPFYQDFYKEFGRKPTKRAIADMLKAELEGETTLLSKTQEVTPFEREIYQQIKDNSVAPEVDTTDYSIAFEAKDRSVSQQKSQTQGTSQPAQPQSTPAQPRTLRKDMPQSKKPPTLSTESKTAAPDARPAQQSAEKSTTRSDVSSSNNTPKPTEAQRAQWDKDNLQPKVKDTAASHGKQSHTERIIEATENNPKIKRATKTAQQTGKEMHFYAKRDTSGRSVGIERFNPKTHTVQSGFVIDRDGNNLGNHIKVDDTGIQVNVNGKMVNTSNIVGNPLEWKGGYRTSETLSRNIDRLAPGDKKRGGSSVIAQRTKEFIVTNKVKAEANYRAEVDEMYGSLKTRIDDTMKAKPRNVKATEYKDDIFSVLNGDVKLNDLKSKYTGEAYSAIKTYRNETRKLYDSLLERVNNERVKYGQEPVASRQDYITHLVEMQSDRNFVGEVATTVRNSFIDDGMQKTRGGVPSEIAGRTENFKPISAYNKFLQRRTGKKSLRDPFLAVQEYIEPALYNIHMTESAARVRAIESAFRTASTIQRMTPEQFTSDMESYVSTYQTGNDPSRLTTAFQEYANALTKKTQRWDRQIIDASPVSSMALKGWQKLQRIGGQSTILGNISSVMMQPLNQVITLSDAGVANYMKGIAANVTQSKAINKSAFINARSAKNYKPIRGVGTKILDAAGVPLQEVELAAVRQTWHTMYAKARSKGLNGQKAVNQADLDTERLVAGRGIADRPELYRSTAVSGILQYTLEVNAQYKALTQDLKPAQLATFVVTSAALNALYEEINGQAPLPDFLTPIIEGIMAANDEDDDRSDLDIAVDTAKREAGEVVGATPIGSAVASTLLTKEQRKALFSSDSDLARYEGTMAPIRVVQNAYSAGRKALAGNYDGAINDALKVTPIGNQIQKTKRGIQANMDEGNTYANDTLVEKTRNVLFGPQVSDSTRRYFDGLDRAKQGLNEQELSAIEAYTRSKKDPISGKKAIEKTVYDSSAKANLLLQNPRSIERLSKLYKWQNAKGDKVDPLWLQSDEEIKKYLQYQTMPPAGADKADWINKNPWYEKVSKARSTFFDSLPESDPEKQDDPFKYPEPSKETQRDLDAYNKEQNPEVRAKFLENHPNIIDQWDAIATYNNEMRAAKGYAKYKEYPKPTPKLSEFIGQYRSVDKDGKRAIRESNPQMYKNMIAYYNSVNLYTINKEGAINQLQGNPDQTSDQNKAIKNLARDIYENADGTYTIVPAGWMDGLDSGSYASGSRSSGGSRTSSRTSTGSRTGSRSSSGSSKANDGLDIDSAKLAMKLKVPETDKAPNVKVTQMKKATLKKYQVVNGKRVPIKVSGRKRVA